MPGPARILIAGAGLGGLTAALACAQKGLAVEVFEQAPALGEVGAGVSISPSSVRVLSELGLRAQLLDLCYYPLGREMIVWNTGYRASLIFNTQDVIARYGQPQVLMHRADLHTILMRALTALQPDAIKVDARAVGFEQTEATVRLKLADGREAVGDALIGADGIHSAVRKQLFGASRPQFTGGIAWRGIIPVERLPAGIAPKYRQAWLGTDGHFVVYRVRRGELVNIVGHIERHDWQVESWTELGTTEEMLSDFAGWHPHVHTLIRNIDKPYKWALFLHPTLEKWSVGRVSLLGDACHSTLPYLGFGANMAIEDGLILARCLEQLPNDIPAALRCYENLRIPRTTEIVNASAANIHRFHHSDLADPDAAKAYIDREAVGQRDSTDWLNTYDATAVSLELPPSGPQHAQTGNP